MDKERFRQACELIVNRDRTEVSQKGIGTLGEKTLHCVLKNYYQPDQACHEIKVGSFVADIAQGNELIEIQTRGFLSLRKKLEYFLKDHVVTVIYPIAGIKRLSWIDQETGEVTKKRKSPKLGSPQEVFYELYQIKHLLLNPNLRFCVVSLELEEYRYLNGWSRDKKRGSSRCDRIPVDILDELRINSREDFSLLIPEALGREFTSKEYKKASGLSLSSSQTALNVLHSVGAAKRTGKLGRLYLYERATSNT